MPAKRDVQAAFPPPHEVILEGTRTITTQTVKTQTAGVRTFSITDDLRAHPVESGENVEFSGDGMSSELRIKVVDPRNPASLTVRALVKDRFHGILTEFCRIFYTPADGWKVDGELPAGIKVKQ